MHAFQLRKLIKSSANISTWWSDPKALLACASISERTPREVARYEYQFCSVVLLTDGAFSNPTYHPKDRGDDLWIMMLISSRLFVHWRHCVLDSTYCGLSFIEKPLETTLIDST